MLAGQGYAVFAVDLFGAGIRPTEVTDRRQHTGELYQNRQKMRALLNGALTKAAELAAILKTALPWGIVSAAQPYWNWPDPAPP